MKKSVFQIFLFLYFLPFSYSFAQSSPEKNYNSADIFHQLENLSQLGSVLYIAAHPDDENTRLIAYLSKQMGIETTYLSLTRGGGGQNLIGKEVGSSLEIVRSQELLSARKIDGGKQLFSRAIDFGYSKNPEETLQQWDKEKILYDMVWAIRKTRPDIIITRFSPFRTGKTHGHHTTSALLSQEAFAMAADKSKFPQQLKYCEPWQAHSLFWNTSWWFFRNNSFDSTKYTPLEVGTYNAVLGKSMGEVSAESRSQHRSQGFGSQRRRGEVTEYFQHLAGEKIIKHLLEKVDYSWKDYPIKNNIDALIERAKKNYNPKKPVSILEDLIKIHLAMQELYKKHKNPRWISKIEQVEKLIFQTMGIWCEAISPQESVAVGDSVKIVFRTILREEKQDVRLEKILVLDKNIPVDTLLKTNRMWEKETHILMDKKKPITQPYWLKEKNIKAMHEVKEEKLIGLPETNSDLSVVFYFRFLNKKFAFSTSLLHKFVNPAVGEIYEPFYILPPATANFISPIKLFSKKEVDTVFVEILSNRKNFKAMAKVKVPSPWKLSPEEWEVNMSMKGERKRFPIQVTSPAQSNSTHMTISIEQDEMSHSYSSKEINYPHIPKQIYLSSPAEIQLVKIDLKTIPLKIGYIQGAGDDIPQSLQLVGLDVEILKSEDISKKRLKKFDVIITGIRSYNVNKFLSLSQEKLMDFVHNGGHLIVQYNTTRNLVTKNIGPYPINISRNRVTMEEAPIKILDITHPLFNFPNKITQADFQGWVQERGLYFPDSWSPKYIALTQTQDPNETPLDGGLLLANYGKGSFIYTSYSWFRQLPAGVGGAFRLFINIISYPKNREK